MNLTPNFTLEEMIASQEASRRGIDNTPSAAIVKELKRTAAGLEGVRVLLGNKSVLVSSGYRCPALNAAVGSKSSSQHLLGQAADFTCPGAGSVEEVFATIKGSNVPFDQLILEFGAWVHISFSPAPRGQCLIIDHQGTRAA